MFFKNLHTILNSKDSYILLLLLISFASSEAQDLYCDEENFWKQEDYLATLVNYDRGSVLLQKGCAAFDYCKQNKMDTTFCLLQDLRVHSGKYRFFVWDFNKEIIVDSALVSHGCGTNPWGKTYSKDCPEFSNENNSGCSSLGKYKIGKKSYSQWGIHINYLLYGLDTTNSNAFSRTIVLHSWEDVPEQEVYPEGTPEGHGCPAVSNSFLKRLYKRLQTTKQPVLLWMYYEE